MRLLAIAAVFAIAALAQAHFVYIVPDAKLPSQAIVIFSDTLEPDDNVTMTRIESLKLYVKDASGKVLPAAFEKGDFSFKVSVPGTGPRIMFGSVNYGLNTRGESKYLLNYHPKALVGGIPADGGRLGELAVLEVVPIASNDKVAFQVLAQGKPLTQAEGSVTLPNGMKEKVITDKVGRTSSFTGPGRYSVWVRHVQPMTGQVNGKQFAEVKHYATLVVDVP